LEENDLAKLFAQDTLGPVEGKHVSFDAMENAVHSWLLGGASSGVTVRAFGNNKQVDRIIDRAEGKIRLQAIAPGGEEWETDPLLFERQLDGRKRVRVDTGTRRTRPFLL